MPESIGQRLKREREARHLTLEKAAESTRVRAHYLQALENDDYSVMSSAAQGRGFLRLYAEFLALDLNAAMDELRHAAAAPADVTASAAVDVPPAPIPAPEPAPASPADGRQARGGFWARILRRPLPESPSDVLASAPAEESSAAPDVSEPKPVLVPPKAARGARPKSSSVEDGKSAEKPADGETQDKDRPNLEATANTQITGKKKQPRRRAETAAQSRSISAEPSPESSSGAPQPPASPSNLSKPFPAPENISEVKNESIGADEFQPQWWERLRASVRLRPSKPRQVEVQEDAGEDSARGQESIEVPPAKLAMSQSAGIKTSDEMFAEIGAGLRARREALNLTREEIERHLHVRAHFLLALEEGDFGSLPSAVQTRGMLSNYAAFLDLDVETLLLRFADVLQVRHRERHPLPPGARGKLSPGAPPRMPALRSFIVADALGILLIVLLVVFSAWGIQRVVQASSQARVEATAPSISDVLLAATEMTTPTSVATVALLDLGQISPTPEIGETLEFVPTLPEGVQVQINIVALERTFLRVTVDGEIAFEGRVTPGTAYPFEAKERIEILAGNGAALQVTFNSRDLGVLGNYGEVVNLVYTANGIFTPTATLVPTPTITRTPTITPSPTKTLVPSRTPTPP